MYGFDSCNGCRDCNCDLASNSSQCDLVSGQCPCQAGVIGQRCDECMEGYWDYDFGGCKGWLSRMALDSRHTVLLITYFHVDF